MGLSLTAGTSAALEGTSRWGLLPIAIGLAAIVAVRLGAIALPNEAPRHRALFGGVGTIAIIAMGTRILGGFGLLRPWLMLLPFAALSVALLFVKRERRLGIAWRSLLGPETAPVVVAAIAALGLVTVAAYFLPVWQWDSVGYHLPYVNFALQRGTFADLPDDVPYLTTYPHDVEWFFTAWRAMLPDDRLVDAAQIPFGLLGAAAVACTARGLGARADHSFAVGLAWMTLPAVVMQLPTNYIDVAAASFILVAAAFALDGDLTPGKLAGVAVALGLFLGSKPNAPVGTTFAFAVVAYRAWKAGYRGTIALVALVILVFGAESYLVNIARHGNPIWPVRVTLGPIKLPGTLPMQRLLDSGAAAPRLSGSTPFRVIRSWTTLNAPLAFDMRYGGLGVVFLAAIPAAVVVAWRNRSVALAGFAAAMLASPDPAVARYVFAFPGLVLAFGGSRLGDISPRLRYGAFALAGLVAAHGLFRAYPELAGEGPPIAAYPKLTEAERLRAVGANGYPNAFYDALDRLGPDDVTAFDASFDLPYLAWPSDLSRRAVRIPDDAKQDDVDRAVSDPHLRLLIVDPDSPLGAAIREKPETFTPLFRCRSAPCTVYFRG